MNKGFVSRLLDLALLKASGGKSKQHKAVDVVDDASEQDLGALGAVGSGGQGFPPSGVWQPT